MVKLPSRITLEKSVISDCGLYRYWLSRVLNKKIKFKPVVFVMLNPSTADSEKDDPTIRRCINYAKNWEASHLIVVNLFAFRSTDPNLLWHENTVDPVGPLNDEAILRAADYAHAHDGILIAAWGEHGKYMSRNQDVLGNIEMFKPMCLKKNKSGNPAHPLYLRKDAKITRIIND